jgi:hypothetical protein
LLFQANEMTSAKYLETFQTLVSVIEQCAIEQYGGKIGQDPVAKKNELEEVGLKLESATDEQIVSAMKIGKEKYLVLAMLAESDNSRYGKLC